MKTEQRLWAQKKSWELFSPNELTEKPQLVLAFGGTERVKSENAYNELSAMYPKSSILICSTAGEIIGTNVNDDSLSVTGILFDKTELTFAEVSIADGAESFEKGKEAASQLNQEGLVHVMVFSDGTLVNGTDLVKGLMHTLPETVSITGGLVGDGDRFKETYVGLNGNAEKGKIVLIGFIGKDLRIGYGSLGGWDPFGPEREITKSKGNILYELDGQPALKLYKEYLGDQADGLPGTGLLFPLMLDMDPGGEKDVEIVRTILGVDEETQSMTFAGDMPEGIYAKLMKANFDRIIDGASGAASMSIVGKDSKPDLAILISCIGRKLVLDARVEEEIEAIQEIMGESVPLTGFYSYGEISPVSPTDKKCQLHNQTMTITTFKEI